MFLCLLRINLRSSRDFWRYIPVKLTSFSSLSKIFSCCSLERYSSLGTKCFTLKNNSLRRQENVLQVNRKGNSSSIRFPGQKMGNFSGLRLILASLCLPFLFDHKVMIRKS